MHLRVAALSCAVLAISSSPVNGGEGLTMRIWPATSMAPAILTVQVTVETDGDNRLLEVVAESEDFYRSSEIRLDGSNAPRVNVFEFRSLPGGVYQVSGRLTRTRGKRFSVFHWFRVMHGGPSGH